MLLLLSLSNCSILFMSRDHGPRNGLNLLLSHLTKRATPIGQVISLTNTLRKVFTRILNKTLTQWAENNQLIDETQAGFSSSRQYFYLICSSRELSKNMKLYVAFIHFQKAYDNVQRVILFQELAKLVIQDML